MVEFGIRCTTDSVQVGNSLPTVVRSAFLSRQLARAVLRGLGGSNPARLPGGPGNRHSYRRDATSDFPGRGNFLCRREPYMTGEANTLHASLQGQLDEFQQQFVATVPPEARAVILETTGELVRLGLAEQALQKGANVPDFALPNGRGETVVLSDLLTRGPVVVAFYRGVW